MSLILETLMNKAANMLIYGSGAVGSSLGGWLSESYANISLLARGEHYKKMKDEGLTLFSSDSKKTKNIAVNVYNKLDDIPDIDILVLCVKNYNLEEACVEIEKKFGKDIIVVGLQNGLINQEILPKFFSKIIYGVVCYNVWVEKPGEVGYQTRGPIYLGTDDNSIKNSIELVETIFNKGLETKITRKYEDAVHSKLILNLTNSVFTLINWQIKDKNFFNMASEITSEILVEGVNTIKKIGYKEHKLGSLPGWSILKAIQILPKFLSTPIFRNKTKKSVISSMTQDVLIRKKNISELESINGYFIELAEKHNLNVPYNVNLYNLCREKFKETPFIPIPINDLYQEIVGKK
jgi:2-dehydropantoate 2-reductase